MKMGSSSSEAGDEDRNSDSVGSDADVVVVDLADAGRATLAHKGKRGAIANREAFVGCIFLFVECCYLIDSGWVVEPQPEKVLCRDYSLDQHCHGQVEKLVVDHH
jgi:hypothetical protein